MPFEIVRNDIVNMQVDAIVNTTNSRPEIGAGVDSDIHQRAGQRLLTARKRIGRLPVGSAAVTSGYDLDAKYVIHTVCPTWRGGDHREAALLRKCYTRSLELARHRLCRSIAFPLMSAGNHSFPKDLALEIAVSTISAFLKKHEMQVYLVVFDRDAWKLSENLFQAVSSFIDETYVREKTISQYGIDNRQRTQERRSALLWEQEESRREFFDLDDELPEPERPIHEDLDAYFAAEPAQGSSMPSFSGFAWDDTIADAAVEAAPAPRKKAATDQAPMRSAAPAFAPKNLDAMLREADAGFAETLFALIDKTGRKDSEIYKKANIDRKLFSKIRKNRNYQPSKPTAVAFAIALELDLQETKDFLARAGFALSHSSKFDIIIEYFILNRNYNIHEINMTLFEFDQSLLGA